MRARALGLLSLLAFFGAGCLTHLPPPRNHAQLLIQWAPDFDVAQARAQAEHKPLFLVLAAGELDGPC